MPSEPALTVDELECRMEILGAEMKLLEAQRELALAKERGERVAKAAREKARAGEAPAVGEQGADPKAPEAHGGEEESAEEEPEADLLWISEEDDRGRELFAE